MLRRKNIILFIAFAFSLTACKKTIHTSDELKKWMDDKENKISITKSVNGLLVTIYYLLPQYSALKEMEIENWTDKKKYDSLLSYYKGSASFIMTLAPDETKNKDDVMYKGIQNFKEYTERALVLNFDMENQVVLTTDKNTYSPQLSSLENTYGLSKDRKINFVFSPIQHKDELLEANQYDFTYQDELFGLGTLHFYFDKKSIENNIPEIVLEK